MSDIAALVKKRKRIESDIEDLIKEKDEINSKINKCSERDKQDYAFSETKRHCWACISDDNSDDLSVYEKYIPRLYGSSLKTLAFKMDNIIIRIYFYYNTTQFCFTCPDKKIKHTAKYMVDGVSHFHATIDINGIYTHEEIIEELKRLLIEPPFDVAELATFLMFIHKNKIGHYYESFKNSLKLK